jgi:hypothetical protein
MDRSGKIIIPPQFEDVGDFFGGLARMEKGQKWGFINEKGAAVIPAQFELVEDFSEGLAPVRVGRRWGYIDRTGKLIIEPQFQGAAVFQGGLGRVEVWDRILCEKDTFTKDDAPLYAFSIYNFYGGFHGGCAPVNNRFGFVDRTGRLAVAPQFVAAEDFAEGLALVTVEQSDESKVGFVDKTGIFVIPPSFYWAHSFSQGLAAVGFPRDGESDAKWGFIDKTGNFILEPTFSSVGNFSDGLASAMTGSGTWGFINKTGEFIIEPSFSYPGEFSDGLALISSDAVNGGFYIDKTLRKAIDINLVKQWWPFSDGLTVAGEYGKRVYVDKKGKIVAPFERERSSVK